MDVLVAVFPLLVLLTSLADAVEIAYQSSTFNDNVASLAIDADPETFAVTGRGSGWWKLDLGVSTEVAGLRLIGSIPAYFQVRVGDGAEETGTLAGFDDNAPCAMVSSLSMEPDPVTIHCVVPKTGRYVSIKIVDDIPIHHLKLCDVEIIRA